MRAITDITFSESLEYFGQDFVMVMTALVGGIKLRRGVRLQFSGRPSLGMRHAMKRELILWMRDYAA